jgi:hypothetical protein
LAHPPLKAICTHTILAGMQVGEAPLFARGLHLQTQPGLNLDAAVLCPI